MPLFAAQLRVVDMAGRPVADATVRHLLDYTTTDASGLAKLSNFDATVAADLTVEKKGLTPQVVEVSASTAAFARQTVVLAPLTVQSVVEPSASVVITGAGARVELPASSLVTPNGTRANQARVELTYLGTDARGLGPSSDKTVDEAGTPTLMARDLGSLFVRFLGEGDAPLELAAGTSATVEFPVAADANVKDGDVLPLWTLGASGDTWKKQARCHVASRMAGATLEQFCRGVVEHFSWWRLGEEAGLAEAGSIGCVAGVVQVVDPDPCHKLSHVSLTALRCNGSGEACEVVGNGERFSLGEPHYRYCGLIATGEAEATYRLLARYLVDANRCERTGTRVGSTVWLWSVWSWRAKLSEPVTRQGFRELLGSEVIRSYTAAPGGECSSACVTLTVPLGREDFEGPRWTDQDDDGWLATRDKDFTAFATDCDDRRADVYPGAPEPLSSSEDRNCDGAVDNPDGAVTQRSP